MVTVYVVGWEYGSPGGGGGFDWYYEKDKAQSGFEQEKKNADDFKEDGWVAVFYEVQVTSYETATEEIEARQDELFDAATVRYQAF